MLSLLLLGLLAACTNDSLGSDADMEMDPEGQVTLQFGLVIPEAVPAKTRGMLDEADGENTGGYLSGLVPYIFIFEDTGQIESNYLRTLVHSTQITPGEDQPDETHSGNYLMGFSATVDGTAEDAIIHIVLVQPDEQEMFEAQLKAITDRSELAMFSGASGLFTFKAAYWKRIRLNMPINTTNKTTIQGLLSHVKLVRNFAQVTIRKDETEVPDALFTLEGFAIVNAMNCGYVAAYNEKTTTGENFVDFQDGSGNPLSYTYLTEEVSYLPSRHPLAERVNKDNDLAWVSALTDSEWRKPKQYMFERPVQDSHRTFVLLRGRFNGSPDITYYKIEIGDYDKREYDSTYNPYGVFEIYNLVRNMSYDITITSVASPGHDSAASAVAGPPSNNITASVETRNIMDIGDGVDRIGINAFQINDGMLVQGTTVVIVDDDNGNPYPPGVNLRWQYWLGEEGQYRNDLIQHNYPKYELKTLQTGGEIITSQSNWNDPGTDWMGYTLTFDKPTDTPKSETVRFYKEYGLSRDVTFILRNRWKFINDGMDAGINVEVYPGHYSFDNESMPRETLSELRDYLNSVTGVNGPGAVGSQRGAQLTVMFELPSDIPQSLFPLDFKIGFDRQNVENAYVGNATVIYGDSMFDDDGSLKGMPRMQFVKTVTWEDYNGSGDRGSSGHKIVCVRFNTTTEVIGNNETDNNNGETSTTRVRVTNPYFTQGDGKFIREVSTPSNPDPDVTRTIWSWYFGDPGWTKYFNETSADHNVAGQYNELWYNSHTWAMKYGQYMEFTTSSGEGNPDFQFWPNYTATANCNAKLSLTGASYTYSRYTGIPVTTWYRRRAFVRVDIQKTDGTSRSVRIEDNTFFFDRRDDDNVGMPKECINNGGIAIEAGETITGITIWSTRYSDDSQSAQYAKTRYYSIRLVIE